MVSFKLVQADVPSLLGMHVLNRERLVSDTVYNRLARRKDLEIGNN